MTIGFDLMGGDLAPQETVKGAFEYLESNNSVQVVLIGDEEICKPFLSKFESFNNRVQFIHAPQTIEMDEHATKALKEKPQSSIVVGLSLLKSGKIDAFLSAGNTGAMLVGAMYTVGAVEGVLRPTIASHVPREEGGHNLLLDVGANADCKPENLAQFAVLGSLYAKYIFGDEDAKVGLVNIGEEEGKGNILVQAAYPLLKDNEHINFVGNVEGRDLFVNKARVFVCEGFTGNVMLKLAESVYDLLKDRISNQDEFFKGFNYENYGGVPILGVNAPVIIGHGISNATAFKAMFESAERVISTGLIDAIKNYFRENK